MSTSPMSEAPGHPSAAGCIPPPGPLTVIQEPWGNILRSRTLDS
jgi:hypothetical protein